MNIKKLSATLAAACAGVVFLTGMAMAMPAQATNSLNVRSGPDRSYRVVDVLHPGERVNVEDCNRNGWCFITHRGRDGWVSSRYLTNTRGYHRDTYRAKPRHYRDDYRPRRRSNGSSFNFSFSIHGDDCYRSHGRIVCR
ncbi:SH3 domain-containing protein [Mariluticola halotolerans]|uniref:SH3 domain-containing protein n=1 Tax=Mariluticola halotolerans TaxID=2909283 RepID=UPI0026E34638|nr:SH3 domain-containing protein [Mariluticola halotolerans]UJQ94466.1 SH3 domain-containing protein [Mariluticola halotolerans]